jgi:G3E family GTPase
MLPAIVVGGYLGAGKTTLVNRLLRGADGRRIAVMVNDFGEVGIDADLIESREGDVLNLAGGCVCCAFGSDLVEALAALPAREPRLDLVLVETSGVALPGAVARAMRLVSGIEVDGVVVIADAERVRALADDRHVGDTVRRQLAEADLLVLNKTDLVDDAALPGLHAWLAGAAPRAVRLDSVEADVPPHAVLGLADDAHRGVAASTGSAPDSDDTVVAEREAVPRRATLRAPRSAAEVFESASFELDGTYDLAALGAALADPALGLVRAKGTLRDAAGGRAVRHAVGARVRTGPAPGGSASAAADSPSRLVVIGLRGALDAAEVAARIGAARRIH